MEPSFFTFNDICRINHHHWDNAYSVMLYHMEHGNLEKVVRGPEDIIYRNINKLKECQLEYDRIFLTSSTPSYPTSASRPKRKRIGVKKVEIPSGEK
ncbi:hypothetical protein [Algoriphagus sp. Y33]|uniref:hypothetical protein n=1 Tax=Algoriphagus sp. Y33 TaxID=2772483 RepID=UPI001784E195|nr:hypothetical protein [Algoriphagus sp. Y33]